MVEPRSLGHTPRGAQSAACAIVTVCLAAIFVILRFFTRTRLLNCLGRDDWCILASLLFSVGNSVGMIVQVEHGFGQHTGLLSAEQTYVFLKASYISIVLYNFSLTLAKVSVLFQYLRIFTTRTVKRICHVQMVIVIIYGLWVILSSIFFCVPVASSWDLTIKGKCLPKGPVWFANAGINIATDIMIVLSPAPLIRKLQLSAKQKIGLYMIFAVGIFICIVSILRLHSLYNATITKDPAYENVAIANWSAIELNTAILCACLPTLRPLIARSFPKLLSSGHGRTSYYQATSGNKSFGASALNRPAKQKTVPDSASEIAIVNFSDDFPLADMDGGESSSHKTGYIEEVEIGTSKAQSNSSSATRHTKHEGV